MMKDEEQKRELTDAELEQVTGGKDVVVRGGRGGFGGGWARVASGIGRSGGGFGRIGSGVARSGVGRIRR